MLPQLTPRGCWSPLWRGRGASPRDLLLRPGSQGPRDQVWPGSPASPQQAALVCSFPSLPRLSTRSQLMAAPSFQLPKPQALASSLPSLCLTHRHPTHQDFLLALPSKYVRSPNISHRFHCRHPGQATVISPLDYCHGLPTFPLLPLPLPWTG